MKAELFRKNFRTNICFQIEMWSEIYFNVIFSLSFFHILAHWILYLYLKINSIEIVIIILKTYIWVCTTVGSRANECNVFVASFVNNKTANWKIEFEKIRIRQKGFEYIVILSRMNKFTDSISFFFRLNLVSFETC